MAATAMELLRTYERLCDVTRGRLLHVLTRGPFRVCHFQEPLGAPRVKTSKHLAYLRSRRRMEAVR
jgi:ArsR family transcriptional regulator, arsenate/arsenite/antimonite-responsive transcriptional repressor